MIDIKGIPVNFYEQCSRYLTNQDSFSCQVPWMAAPLVLVNIPYDATIYRMMMDITGHRQKVFFRINQYGLVSPSK